jgi:sulfate permease, SulP family
MTPPGRRARAAALLPPLAWLRGYGRADLTADAIAGVTVAVMLVPQAMAYAALAGMPPVTGLYAATVPLVAYALLGTSGQLAFGPVAIVSLLTASTLAPLADGDPAAYAGLAALLAGLVGVIHLALGVLRLGGLAHLLSQPMISGFTSAAALVIAATQLPGLLGLPVEAPDGFVAAVAGAARHLWQANPATVVVGSIAVAALLAGRRLPKLVPVPLIVVAAATAATALLGLDRAGVAILGEVPAGLPLPGLPPLDADAAARLLPGALAIALVGYAEGISVAQAIAARTRSRIDPNQELLASGAANLAAALFRAFPVAGGFSRTAVNHQAGARTPLSSLVTAAGVALTALALTPLFFHLPRAVLAAIVVVAALGLVDPRTARRVWRTDRADGLVLTVTAVVTLAVGVEAGLGAGVALGLAVLIWRSARPHVAELGRVEGTRTLRNVTRYRTRTDPRVAVIRVDGPLTFANASRVGDLLRGLAAERPALETVVLDCSAIPSLDSTGASALARAIADLEAGGIALYLATVRGPVRDTLRRAGAWAGLERRVHQDVPAALGASGIDPDSPLVVEQAGEEPPAELH